MNKLILRKENGTEIEVKEITQLTGGKLIFLHLNVRVREEEIKQMEENMSRKIGTDVIILDSIYRNEIQSI